MTRRLVLGCGAVGRVILGSIRSWPGTVTAVVEEESRADELRGANVDARVGDPADPANFPDAVDVVLTASDDSATNERAAAAARERFPDALVLSCGEERPGAPAEERNGGALDEATENAPAEERNGGVLDEATENAPAGRGADQVVDPTAAVADRVLNLSLGLGSRRLVTLLDVLKSLTGPLAVVMHDNPDPDAIASAIALATIADAVGVDADPCYFGEISHQENRALVNLLDVDLRNLEDGSEIDEYAGVALVDHSRPGVNDGLSPETEIDVVIDHHPPRAPVQATYVDLRSEVGSTSTLLADYLNRFDLEPSREVATALLYGIRVDTRDFTREVAEADFEAAATLLPYVDNDILQRVETPNMSAAVFDTLSRAIQDRTVRGDVIVSCVGFIRDRDSLAQAAEHLLNMEGIRISLVYGIRDDTVYVSGRARGTSIDLGEMLRDALGSIGSAGGHADMAGAQLSLGIIVNDLDSETESVAESEPTSESEATSEGESEATSEGESEAASGGKSEREVVDIVRQVVTERFFETLDEAPSAFGPSAFDGDEIVADEFHTEREG
jgi:nanoRNase/pAp phosphatase (c-di-AMP/oligoRNAs hydrolase)